MFGKRRSWRRKDRKAGRKFFGRRHGSLLRNNGTWRGNPYRCIWVCLGSRRSRGSSRKRRRTIWRCRRVEGRRLTHSPDSRNSRRQDEGRKPRTEAFAQLPALPVLDWLSLLRSKSWPLPVRMSSALEVMGDCRWGRLSYRHQVRVQGLDRCWDSSDHNRQKSVKKKPKKISITLWRL